MSWSTLESSPAVFTELLGSYGVKDVEVEELYDMEESSFKAKEPVHGLVFLFKHTGARERREGLAYAPEMGEVWFANQVISNACGTQALLHVVMNTPSVDLGPTVSNFKEFTASFPPDIKGNAMNESPEMRTAHNSFARPEPFVMEDSKDDKEDADVFHFVAYMPINGVVYELDGLQRGPIILGSVPESGNWFPLVKRELERRIEMHAGRELRFTLLALCKAQKAVIRDQRANFTARMTAITNALATVGAGGTPAAHSDADPSFSLAGDAAGLALQLAQTTAALKDLDVRDVEQDAKYARYRLENIRRRHNYVPFIIQLFKELATKKELLPLMDAAKERAEVVRKANAERRKALKEAAARS